MKLRLEYLIFQIIIVKTLTKWMHHFKLSLSSSVCCECCYLVSVQPWRVPELLLWLYHQTVEAEPPSSPADVRLHPRSRAGHQVVPEAGSGVWHRQRETAGDLGPESERVSRSCCFCVCSVGWSLLPRPTVGDLQAGASYSPARCPHSQHEEPAVPDADRLCPGRRQRWTGERLPTPEPPWREQPGKSQFQPQRFWSRSWIQVN